MRVDGLGVLSITASATTQAADLSTAAASATLACDELSSALAGMSGVAYRFDQVVHGRTVVGTETVVAAAETIDALRVGTMELFATDQVIANGFAATRQGTSGLTPSFPTREYS